MTALIGQELKEALVSAHPSLSDGRSGMMLKGWLQTGSSIFTLFLRYITLYGYALHILFGFTHY